jgi:hypothetical protein
MTPVKQQISKFKADKILPSRLKRVMAALYLQRLLSESSRPYVLAYYMSAFVDCAYFCLMSFRENIMLQTLFELHV